MPIRAKKKAAAKNKGKAVVYLREVELRFRKRKVTDKSAVGRPIRAAQQVVALFADMQNEAKEKLITIHLDTKNRILCFEVYSHRLVKRDSYEAHGSISNVISCQRARCHYRS